MLATGTRLGAYEVVSAIGAGGMGEVYKGRDTRLDRIVALKVLPHAYAADTERNLRFAREARAISSLSHPHICALYDLGQQDGIAFLVMEYLEGETLEDRLRKGALSIEDALRFGVQMAQALDHAHRLGIVHRDLKPANIMLTHSGAKLLDFGLAKAVESTGASAGAATSLPTVSRSLTTPGVVIGTFQYMAPEQLEGGEADARTDIFAFGAVLYEMLTGTKPFQGKSQASLIAAIMNGSLPPMATIAPMTPPALEHLVRTCLAKDPDARWQTAHDVLVQLQWLAEGGAQLSVPGPAAVRRRNREWAAWACAAISILALAAVLWIRGRDKEPDAPPVSFTIEPPAGTNFVESTFPAVSPDGRKIVFTAANSRSETKLWLRTLDSPEARELPVTGTPGAPLYPFWSPDSRYIGCLSGNTLLKLDIRGGSPISLARVGGLGGTWNANGIILIGAALPESSLRRVSESGGEVTIVRSPNPAVNETALYWPTFLPDGRHFLYFSANSDTSRTGARIGALDSNETVSLPPGGGRASYAQGFLLFPRQSALFAQSFDTRSLRLTGSPARIAEGIGSLGALGANYSTSQNGTLAYRSGGSGLKQMTWYDRSGHRISVVLAAGRYRQAALSPDARYAAIEKLEESSSRWGIWLLDLNSGILSRFTDNASENGDPVWSPDGRQIAFASNRRGTLDVFRQAVGSSTAEAVWIDSERKVPESWLQDGRILFTTATGKNYFLISQDGHGKPEAVLQNSYTSDEPSVSPDGRWVALGSLESGRWEVYVASFPGFTDKRQVSKDGGGVPRWRADGKELYFLGLTGAMMAVDFKAGPIAVTGPPHPLFGTDVLFNPLWDQYGVTANGSKFLVAESTHDAPKPITVVLNWAETLGR
jgi:serine/threonine protein kinase/Tol biopolymer transport system component